MNYIDLFSGAGGFSLGFDNLNFENIFSVDIDSSFCETYRHNFPNHNLIQDDISSITDIQLRNLKGKKNIDVVIGGPPCQGFSMAGNIGRKFINDPRNRLFTEFVRVVNLLEPRYFVMENVARLFTHNKGATRKEIIDNFEKIGYNIRCEILNSADYGVPQIRRRVIFIGSKIHKNIIFPEKTVKKYISVKQALSCFPVLESGQESIVPNHIAMSHSDQMLNKMKYIKDGGNRDDIPFKIRPKTGDARKYIRYSSNMPSICVTGDMRKVFHYEQNRALTVRELAALQSFPDDFVFKGARISQQQQVGNSVPPLMAQAIAQTILEMESNEIS